MLRSCAALWAPLAVRAQLSLAAPASLTLFTESGRRALTRHNDRWQAPDVEVTAIQTSGVLSLGIQSPRENPLRLHVRWNTRINSNLQFLGDAWERSYGDLAFRHLEPDRVMPWYVVATNGSLTHAFGVKTGASALCYWQVDPQGVSLWCDLRNGGRAVQLGSRILPIADIVDRTYSDRSPFESAKSFCRLLCNKPRRLPLPIYGGNNWYYAYGKSSAEDIRQDSERLASVSQSLVNRPVMVIDDGWQQNPTAGPWRAGNKNFPDMAELAADMLKIGVKPGLWTRPLFTRANIPDNWKLSPFTLDPTNPEAAASIDQDMRTVVGWGYQLIKHDFSTFDLLGRWGFEMGSDITRFDWSFQDRTRTTAEIIRDFYVSLRKAAGETPEGINLLGCNTIGHLSAGIFEAQRTGDDTSGRNWTRTRKMGVNTLAFRMPQHNTFFAIDADCVGLTKDIAWNENRQWLDLLAHSGTPLFVSIAPDALGAEQKLAIKQAFQIASQNHPVAEPTDWLTNNEPQHWSAQGRPLTYDWS